MQTVAPERKVHPSLEVGQWMGLYGVEVGMTLPYRIIACEYDPETDKALVTFDARHYHNHYEVTNASQDKVGWPDGRCMRLLPW